MAILIDGQACPLCGLSMNGDSEVICFRPFVQNDRDPLFAFSDSCFHRSCFERDERAPSVVKRYNEYVDSSKRWPPQCVVCKLTIATPDEHFGFGFLTGDSPSVLANFNYAHAHRRCLPALPLLVEVFSELKSMRTAGQWTGKAVDGLIGELEPFVKGQV